MRAGMLRHPPRRVKPQLDEGGSGFARQKRGFTEKEWKKKQEGRRIPHLMQGAVTWRRAGRGEPQALAAVQMITRAGRPLLPAARPSKDTVERHFPRHERKTAGWERRPPGLRTEFYPEWSGGVFIRRGNSLGDWMECGKGFSPFTAGFFLPLPFHPGKSSAPRYALAFI